MQPRMLNENAMQGTPRRKDRPFIDSPGPTERPPAQSYDGDQSRAWLYRLISYMIVGIITAFLASSWVLGGPRFSVSRNLV